MTELEARGDATVAGLVQGFSELDRRARALAPAQLQQGRQLLQLMQDTTQQALQTQIRGITSVVNTLQATAYGDKGALLSPNNLRLAVSQLFWNLLDPVLQAAGLVTPQTATVLAALAPVGTLVTGALLVGGRQQERFVSGVSQVPLSGGPVRESLRGRIADGLWPEFSRRRNVPVTATVVEPRGITNAFVSANVNGGVLEIGPAILPGRVTSLLITRLAPAGGPLTSVTVAWTVDTGANLG